jgi:hypothetical protein
MSPSLPSSKIASPQGLAPRAPARLGPLRAIAVAAATAVLVGGAWLYYDIYTRQAAREAAAEAASRLEETARQLARERSRRLLAEAASRKAATGVAEGRTAATRLQDAMRQAEAELADMRREKQQAARALASANELAQQHRLARDRAEAEIAVAKSRIAETEAKLARLTAEEAAAARPAEQPQVDQREKEELQQARTALAAANKMIEELHAGQLEPMPDSSEPVADGSPCVRAVQGKVVSGPKGPTTWAPANLNRLCQGAEASEEPGRCFQELMLGKVNWGGGTTWSASNALALCGATQSARKTIDCFKRKVASNQPWRTAIKQCKAN